MNDAATIDALGWRQGSILPPDLVRACCPIRSAAPFECPEGTHALLVTQDCDLVHEDFDAEPWCEAIVVRPVAIPDGMKKDFRNPRLLHLPVRAGGEEKFFAIHARERLYLPREALSGSAPAVGIEITAGKLDLLLEWLAQRYTRPALPDEFVERLRKNQKMLKKLFDSRHQLLREIYLRLNPFAELPESTSYQVQLLLVVRREDFEAKRDDLHALARDLERAISGCPGIGIEDSLIQPDDRTSLRQLDTYVPWLDFDYLSHRKVE